MKFFKNHIHELKALLILSGTILLLIFCLHTAKSLMLDQSQQRISQDILRLHVVANSDSDTDQSVKLLVRDSVLSFLAPYTKDCSSLPDAARVTKDLLPQIEETARETLAENGFDYDVSASLEDTDFPVKTYGDLTFPAGTYTALNIRLGEAKGHNWWCVMYPPLCFTDFSTAVVPDSSKEYLRQTLEEEDYKVLENGGKIIYRSYLLDTIKEWLN